MLLPIEKRDYVMKGTRAASPAQPRTARAVLRGSGGVSTEETHPWTEFRSMIASLSALGIAAVARALARRAQTSPVLETRR